MLEYAIIVISYIHILLTFIKAIFPGLPIGSAIDTQDRGVRTILITELYGVFLFFRFIQDYMGNRTKKYFIGILLCSITIFLSGTRQRMLAAIVFAIFFLFKNLKKSYRIVLVIGCLFATILIIRTTYISNMINMTVNQLQSDNPHEAIRTIGITYYLTEFPKKGINQYIGNGIPSYSRSNYGIESKDFAESSMIHLVDIGLIGIYNYFGIIGLIFLLIIFYKFITIKEDNQYTYCKYFLMFILSNSLTSGVLLFYYQIPMICISAYLFTPIKKNHGCIGNYCKL